MEKCISCNKSLTEGVKFNCPICKKEINRCAKCRSLSIEYKCTSCGFIGP